MSPRPKPGKNGPARPRNRSFGLDGPLSDDELKMYRQRFGLRFMLEGRDLFDFEGRVLAEMLTYRAMKKLFVTMDEQHSSMGTAAVTRYSVRPEGNDGNYLGAFPMAQLGFNFERGRRFVILVHELPRDKTKRPRKNPYLRMNKKRRKEQRENRG